MCHSLANCSNIPGSYNCTCNPGYSGDGFTDCTGMCELVSSCFDKKDFCSCFIIHVFFFLVLFFLQMLMSVSLELTTVI